MRIKKYLKSFYSILLINLNFFYSKFDNKKTILFFHPVDDLTKIHDFYLRKLFKKIYNILLWTFYSGTDRQTKLALFNIR